MTEYPGSLDPDVLTVLVEGSAREPERLLMIARPRRVRGPAAAPGNAGARVSTVRVREWSSGSWSVPPNDRDVDTAVLLAEIEQAFAKHRRVGQELYRVRRWLLGGAA